MQIFLAGEASLLPGHFGKVPAFYSATVWKGSSTDFVSSISLVELVYW